MDIIRFTFTRTEIDDKEYGGNPPSGYTHEFNLAVYVNDKSLCLNTYFLNISHLESAMQESCAYPIFVCGCGDEGCAGIFTTPRIIVTDSTITWEIYEPKHLIYEFDKAQIFSACRELRESMLACCDIAEWEKTLYLASDSLSTFITNTSHA